MKPQDPSQDPSRAPLFVLELAVMFYEQSCLSSISPLPPPTQCQLDGMGAWRAWVTPTRYPQLLLQRLCSELNSLPPAPEVELVLLSSKLQGLLQTLTGA